MSLKDKFSVIDTVILMLFLNISSLTHINPNFLMFLPFPVSIEDPLFDLYNSWMWDMTKVMGIMIGFIIMLAVFFVLHYKR